MPAAELPPLVDEVAEKLPFWKKEISFGGKKRDKAPRSERAGANQARHDRSTGDRDIGKQDQFCAADNHFLINSLGIEPGRVKGPARYELLS